MTAAGRSARAEYARRRRLDRAERLSELRRTVPAVAIAAAVTFAVVRLGLAALATWRESQHGPSASGLLPALAPVRIPAELQYAVAAATAVAVSLGAVRAGTCHRQSSEAWRRGAAGEERVGRALDRAGVRSGWVVRHDLAIPGSRANIDHLVVSPSGIFVIDTKNYRGRLTMSDSALWHGSIPLTSMLDSIHWQVGQVARLLELPPTAPQPVICVLGATLPCHSLEVRGVTVVGGVEELLRVIRRTTSRGVDNADVARLRSTVSRLSSHS